MPRTIVEKNGPLIATDGRFEDDFVTTVKMNVRFLSNVKFNKTYFYQII